MHKERDPYPLRRPTLVKLRPLRWHMIQWLRGWLGLQSPNLLVPPQDPFPVLLYLACLYERFNGRFCLLESLSSIQLKSSHKFAPLLSYLRRAGPSFSQEHRLSIRQLPGLLGDPGLSRRRWTLLPVYLNFECIKCLLLLWLWPHHPKLNKTEFTSLSVSAIPMHSLPLEHRQDHLMVYVHLCLPNSCVKKVVSDRAKDILPPPHHMSFLPYNSPCTKTLTLCTSSLAWSDLSCLLVHSPPPPLQVIPPTHHTVLVDLRWGHPSTLHKLVYLTSFWYKRNIWYYL